MNKLRLFLVVVSATISVYSRACGPSFDEEQIPLFVLHMPVREAINENNVAAKNSAKETLDFWYKYTSGAISREKLAEAIKDLSYETFLNNEQGKNLLTTFLTRRHDQAALAYLRCNAELLYGSNNDGWSYHEEYTPAQWANLLSRIKQLSPTGKLADRVQYLKVRCLFKMNRYNDIITLWRTKLRLIQNVDLRNRIEGYVGGAYFWTKQYNQAVDIFQQQGDIRSINYIVNKILASSSKEAIYAHSPNSLALEYAMQDYANYYYKIMKSKRLSTEVYSVPWNVSHIDDHLKSVYYDYEKTLSLAKRVLAEGKTHNPMFWATFIGFIKWANGDADEAYSWLCKAQDMKGNEQMAYCLRLYKFLAAIDMVNKPSGFNDYFLAEYRFFLNNSKTIALRYQNMNDDELINVPSEQEMANCAFTTEITPRAIKLYAPQGGLTQILLQGISDRYGMYGYDGGLSVRYFEDLDKVLTIEQDIDILKQYKKGGKGKIEKTLIALAGDKVLSTDILNEVIGTKLIRATRFSEAEQYLAEVSLSYLSSLSTASYLGKRVMPSTPFRRQNSEDYWVENFTLRHNVKQKFAHDMSVKQSNINLLTGDAKAQAQYDLANHLFQASSFGDLWAISEYRWTSYQPESELVPHIVKLLYDAKQNAQTVSQKKKIWFALAGIPNGENSIETNWSMDAASSYWNFSSMAPWQKEAYRNLASIVTPSDPLYRSCDILRCYMRHHK